MKLLPSSSKVLKQEPVLSAHAPPHGSAGGTVGSLGTTKTPRTRWEGGSLRLRPNCNPLAGHIFSNIKASGESVNKLTV